MPIVQQVIEDYVTNMRDDTVYWQTQSDGTTKGEFAYRYTELSTLVMKLYCRLLDALEDEALAYIEAQQVARNGCEVLRLLKSRYALETQYIETDLITKVHTWTFDKNDLERSIIEWERLIHRLSTQHNFKFEPRQLLAILIRGLPEYLRLTMNRDGIVEFLALRGRVIEYCRNKRLSDPIHSNEVNSAMMCPVRKGTTKGVSKGRYAEGKSGFSWEQKGRGKQGKGKGKKEHDYASMFYYFLDGHSRSNLHVSLPIQDFIRLVRGSWQSRESTMRKTPAECGNSGTKRNIERWKFERTRSYGYTFNLSMVPATEFMEYDRTDEFLESVIEPESTVLRYSLATKLETKN